MSRSSPPSSAPSAVDGVIGGVLSMIVTSSIDAGAMLPAESELAEQFAVSRLTVREAMKTLVALGVVTVARGRGTSVNATSRWSRFHPAVLSSLVRNPGDRAEASRQLVEARRLVEIGVAELAAERRDERHLELLTGALDDMWDAHERADSDAWASADLQFHDVLMEAAGNPFIAVLFVPLGELLRRDRHEPARSGSNRRRALAWHQRILDAVRAADAAAARATMDGHLRDTQEILAEWRSAQTGDDAASSQGVSA